MLGAALGADKGEAWQLHRKMTMILHNGQFLHGTISGSPDGDVSEIRDYLTAELCIL